MKIAATCAAASFATGETPVASCRNGSSQKLSQVQLLRQPSCDACDNVLFLWLPPSFPWEAEGISLGKVEKKGSWGWWHVQVRPFISTSFLVTALSHLPTRYNGYCGTFLRVILSLWDVRFWWGVEWRLAGQLVCTVILRRRPKLACKLLKSVFSSKEQTAITRLPLVKMVTNFRRTFLGRLPFKKSKKSKNVDLTLLC